MIQYEFYWYDSTVWASQDVSCLAIICYACALQCENEEWSKIGCFALVREHCNTKSFLTITCVLNEWQQHSISMRLYTDTTCFAWEALQWTWIDITTPTCIDVEHCIVIGSFDFSTMLWRTSIWHLVFLVMHFKPDINLTLTYHWPTIDLPLNWHWPLIAFLEHITIILRIWIDWPIYPPCLNTRDMKHSTDCLMGCLTTVTLNAFSNTGGGCLKRAHHCPKYHVRCLPWLYDSMLQVHKR